MRVRWCLILPILLAVWLGATSLRARAAGRVELELVTEERVPITAQQDWLRRLAQAGVTNLRIRAKRPLDKVAIEVRGSQAAPIYGVTGVITSGNELVVSGGRFKPTDVARFAQWLNDLAQHGPPEQRPAKAAFGLNVDQFQQVQDALARPLGFPTKGMNRPEVVERVGRQLLLPLRFSPQMLRKAKEDKVAEELSGLTCGTALAYAVRPLGLCLVPREVGGGRLELMIVKAGPKLEAWPVGWEPEKPGREVLPAMYEFLNVNLEGVAVTKVLEELGARLKVPILLDHNALARHGIEPEKVFVDFPQSRTTYSLVLRRVLFQARLKSELRVDEAGNPFIWVTTLKPL